MASCHNIVEHKRPIEYAAPISMAHPLHLWRLILAEDWALRQTQRQRHAQQPGGR